MEPAQPADRVPADRTPPDGQPPVTSTGVPAEPAPAAPAAVEPDRAVPAAVAPDPDVPAAVEPDPMVPAAVEPDPDLPAGVEPDPDVPPVAGPPARAARPPAAGGGKSRSERSSKDMALSLLVLLVPIALIVAFYRGFLGGEQPTTVDATPAYEQARSAGAFPVSQPAGLGSGWRTVSAGYRTENGGATLRVGYLSPEGGAAQLVESNVPPQQLIPAELTDQGQPQGPADLPGGNWQKYTGRGNEQALVLLEPNRTVIVVGDARENELRTLATSLR
ncbi:DUF4245 family protein [Micromonospora sp. NPDC000089]|uniref:DUF4245 domain-containing protein n=1 Tax=unclassified Micromonospora TaxID=2617518 RepID=UPI0036938915